MDRELENDCMQLIAMTGTARSSFIEGIYLGVMGEVEKAEEMLQEGKDLLCEAHEVHLRLLARDAEGNLDKTPLLLVHAEDQMSGAEIFETLASQVIRIQRERMR